MLEDTDADDANQGGVAEHVDVEASNRDDVDYHMYISVFSYVKTTQFLARWSALFPLVPV